MNMTNVNVSELQGAQLDWAVAKIEGLLGSDDDEDAVPGKLYWISGYGITPGRKGVAQINPQTGNEFGFFCPSTDWIKGGQIIERERIAVHHALDFRPNRTSESSWVSCCGGGQPQRGNTPLIAAMRAFVASKLGSVVVVPV